MDFFQAIYEWFTVGIYDFVVETAAYFTYQLIWMRIQAMIWLYTFSWTIAGMFITDLQLAERMASVVGLMSPTIKSNLEFFNVFTGMAWILQAYITRFVLAFLKR
jgi:hypothetical protein